jgi:CelD/BcsL family acetyltransferase involved in cellulose biosynthesis
MIAELVKQQRCRIFTLRVDGICRAYIVGFCLRGAFRIPYLAHDPSMLGNFSLSLICNVMAIEQCILEGLHQYDLTRGSEGYKAHLGGVLRQNFSTVVYRNSASECLAGITKKFIAPMLHHRVTRQLRHLVRG